MNKFLRSTIAAAASVVIFAGCTIPGTNTKVGGKKANTDSYSYSPTETENPEQVYEWLIKPSIQADNIISFDASKIDPDKAESKMYYNYSVIRQSGRYGLIDYSGNIIISPDYDDYYLCSCGEIVLFNVIDERKGEYEYVTLDKDDHPTDIPSHTENSYSVYYWDISTQKVFEGESDSDEVSEYTGKRTVAVTEANVELDDYGSLKVSVPDDALCGLAKEGALLVDCQYDAYYAPSGKSIGNTYVAFRNAAGKWGYFDNEGQQIIDFICDGDPNAYNGMTNDDQLLIHPYLFCDEYLPVYTDGFYSYYDLDGEQVVRQGEFSQARPVNNGRAWIKQGEYWGIIQLGEIVEEEKEKPKDDSSSQVTSTTSQYYYWTESTEEDESADETELSVETDENGNAVTTADTGEWTDTAATLPDDAGQTDTQPVDTEPVYTEPVVTEPAFTEQPVYTDPVYTEPAVPELPGDFFE